MAAATVVVKAEATAVATVGGMVAAVRAVVKEEALEEGMVEVTVVEMAAGVI